MKERRKAEYLPRVKDKELLHKVRNEKEKAARVVKATDNNDRRT